MFFFAQRILNTYAVVFWMVKNPGILNLNTCAVEEIYLGVPV